MRLGCVTRVREFIYIYYGWDGMGWNFALGLFFVEKGARGGVWRE
jgi:hypothetical protein